MGLLDWLSPKQNASTKPSGTLKPGQVLVEVPILDAKLSDFLDLSSVLPEIWPIAERHAKLTVEMTSSERVRYMQTLHEQNDVVWGVWVKEDQKIDVFPLKGYVIVKSVAMGRPNVLADDRAPKITAILCTLETGSRAQLMAEGFG